MIPLIQKEAAEKKHWVTDDDILEIVAIAESTPGPTAINSSTFIGYRVAGVWGAFFGTLGMVLPSFVIILAIAFLLREFQQFPAVQYAFRGIRAGVLALILKALWSMYRKAPKGLLGYLVMAAAFVCTAFLHIHAVIVIEGCAAVGLIASLLAERRAK